ncbi:YIP1 family protein [Actibacterium sp. XHP0104]|uniref:YIP1 family protein n=1 Tax=Actibacterium sp. XHP0104 TaxID=2984335 RepID=UPI0021E928BE|nr:YIP1 family protein [Actibacterium sp. XHP0104]MCV2881220.1 YIP1 family protein [Actibacterium sp. XHP0104]
MSVTQDIVRTYRAPRAVVRRQLAGGENEPRALVYLMAACLLIFVSTLPGHSRDAYLNPEIPLDARIGGSLLSWMIFVPLLMYALAAISHVIARLLGGKGTGFGARIALFWALLAAAPLWLLYGLLDGFVGQGQGPGQMIVGAIGLCAFLAFWGLGLIEAERPLKE